MSLRRSQLRVAACSLSSQSSPHASRPQASVSFAMNRDQAGWGVAHEAFSRAACARIDASLVAPASTPSRRATSRHSAPSSSVAWLLVALQLSHTRGSTHSPPSTAGIMWSPCIAKLLADFTRRQSVQRMLLFVNGAVVPPRSGIRHSSRMPRHRVGCECRSSAVPLVSQDSLYTNKAWQLERQTRSSCSAASRLCPLLCWLP